MNVTPRFPIAFLPPVTFVPGNFKTIPPGYLYGSGDAERRVLRLCGGVVIFPQCARCMEWFCLVSWRVADFRAPADLFCYRVSFSPISSTNRAISVSLSFNFTCLMSPVLGAIRIAILSRTRIMNNRRMRIWEIDTYGKVGYSVK